MGTATGFGQVTARTYDNCKYKHNDKVKTPGAVRKAAEKVEAGKRQQQQQKSKAFPMTTPNSTPASAPLS